MLRPQQAASRLLGGCIVHRWHSAVQSKPEKRIRHLGDLYICMNSLSSEMEKHEVTKRDPETAA